jgi:uncharacterized protein (TIGR02246 family)
MRAPWIIAIAISLAASQASAQSLQQQIEKIKDAYSDNWNKQNAAGIADLYTKDGILVTSSLTKPVKIGTQDIVQHYVGVVFKVGLVHNQASIDQVMPLGTDMAISLGEYHLSGQGEKGPVKSDGHWTAVYVHDGGTWKIRLLTAVENPPPAQ